MQLVDEFIIYIEYILLIIMTESDSETTISLLEERVTQLEKQLKVFIDTFNLDAKIDALKEDKLKKVNLFLKEMNLLLYSYPGVAGAYYSFGEEDDYNVLSLRIIIDTGYSISDELKLISLINEKSMPFSQFIVDLMIAPLISSEIKRCQVTRDKELFRNFELS
ncbi:MAG: hypothetical protein ACTSYA_13360 [Candidatus Kariarchaeaceae archaeon]